MSSNPKQGELAVGKGETAEEVMLEYFLTLGYFAVRGIQLQHNDSSVTDVDLWLYSRVSPMSRLRINVDIKDKKSPKAMERIFWAAGVQKAFDLEQCIVATSDSRRDVMEWGKQHGVTVLNGNLLRQLKGRGTNGQRLFEEELRAECAAVDHQDWYARLVAAKSTLLAALNFDGCNRLLDDVSFFLTAAMEEPKSAQVAVRLAYATVSYFLVCVDFTMGEFVSESQEQKQRALESGLMFGRLGQDGLDGILEISASLLSAHTGNRIGSPALRQLVLESASQLGVHILSQHYASPQVSQRLFDSARAFDRAAYARNHVPPDDLAAPQKSDLAVLLDFRRLGRKDFFEATSR